MQTFLHIKVKRLFIPSLILLTVVLVLVFLPRGNNAPRILLASGYKVDAKDTTFRGYATQKISASKNNEQVILQIVKGVEKDASGDVLSQLSDTLNDIQQKVIITDPYSGRQQELSIPESLKPVREDIVIRETPMTYYIVYANEIFSMKIFSETEAVHKGIFSTYYCPKEKTAYALEIYSDPAHFDKQNQISLLSLLYCK